MEFQDAELQQIYKRNVESVRKHVAASDDDERELLALFGAYDWFRFADKEEKSPRSAAIIQALLAPELRSALRRWYQRAGENMNPAAIAFRDFLSGAAGEKLG
jgi:hypothetical protein